MNRQAMVNVKCTHFIALYNKIFSEICKRMTFCPIHFIQLLFWWLQYKCIF